MDCSTPGFPVHHQLPEPTQTHVHWVGDAIQPSHPLSSPSPPVFNLSQHQGLFQWVGSSHQLAQVLEFQLQHQSWLIIQAQHPPSFLWSRGWALRYLQGEEWRWVFWLPLAEETSPKIFFSKFYDLNWHLQDLPGGTVAETPCSQCRRRSLVRELDPTCCNQDPAQPNKYMSEWQLLYYLSLFYSFETVSQEKALKRLGLWLVQGYFYSILLVKQPRSQGREN